MPYKPSIEGLDYYKAGFGVAAGDARWLKLDQTTPQTVSGVPIFSNGMDIAGRIKNTKTTMVFDEPIITIFDSTSAGLFATRMTGGGALDEWDFKLNSSNFIALVHPLAGADYINLYKNTNFFAGIDVTGDIYASTINTEATRDLKLFDTGNVGDETAGRVLQIFRKTAGAGTQTLTVGTDPFRQTYLWTTGETIFTSKGSTLYEHILWRNVSTEFQVQHQALGDVTLFNSDGSSIDDEADGRSLWLFRKANEGTDSIRAYINTAREGSIVATGVLVLESGTTLALRTSAGSSVLLGDDGNSDVCVGSPWMWLGDKNPILTHYGYVTAPDAIKNVSFNLSSDGVYYIGRQDTTIDHMQIGMPVALNFPDDSFGELRLHKDSVDSTHILYSFSHRSNNKDLWLYAYDGSSYKNFMQLSWDNANVDFTSNSLSTSGDINTASSSVYYLGDSATDGTWRILRDGDNISFQRRESGSYVEKGKFQP